MPREHMVSGSRTNTETLARYVDRVIDSALHMERIVGAVVLIAVDGEPVYERAAGMADREARVLVRRDTVFRLASVSKIIVSTVALAMVERGMISLEDAVSAWLPETRKDLELFPCDRRAGCRPGVRRARTVDALSSGD